MLLSFFSLCQEPQLCQHVGLQCEALPECGSTVVPPEAAGEQSSVRLNGLLGLSFAPGPTPFPAELWGGMMASLLPCYVSSVSELHMAW